MSFRNETKSAFRDLYESQGKNTHLVVHDMLEAGKINVDKMSLKEIWEAVERHEDGTPKAANEALSSDMFPKISGELISKKIRDGYENVETIGDRLATTVPSNMEIETFVGFDEVEMPEEVLQGASYKDSDMGENYTTVPHKKYGRLISVTEEAVHFDKTGQLLMRASRIGKKAAQYREQLIVEAIQDINSDVFRPSGVAEAFYRTSDSGVYRTNSKSGSAFGESSLNEAMKLIHNQKDENGNYVSLSLSQLIGLFPFDLWTQAEQMVNSTLVPEGNENAVNTYKKKFLPLTSPYVTAQSSSTWYIGDFKEDFVWSEVWPLQTFTDTTGVMNFTNDIKARYKVRLYGQAGALSSNHSYKLTS